MDEPFTTSRKELKWRGGAVYHGGGACIRTPNATLLRPGNRPEMRESRDYSAAYGIAKATH